MLSTSVLHWDCLRTITPTRPWTDLADRTNPLPKPVVDFIGQADDAIDDQFQRLRGNPVADKIFYLASEGADYSRAWHVIGIIMAVVSPSRRRHALRLAISLGIESAIVNGALKNVFPRERCLLYTSPSPRDATLSRMPSSA